MDQIYAIVAPENISHLISAIDNEKIEIKNRKNMALEYLAKRRATQETGRNFLIYDNDNATGLNIMALRAIKNLDSNTKWYETTENQEIIAKMVDELKHRHEEAASKERMLYRKYGVEQALIFAGTGAAFAGITYAIGSAVHAIMDSSTQAVQHTATPSVSSQNAIQNPHVVSTTHPSAMASSLDAYLNNTPIHRIHLDNNTLPSNLNELRIWNSHGSLTIAPMLEEFSKHGNIRDLIHPQDLVNGKAFALLTVDGKSFQLAISRNGIIDIPTDLKQIVEGKGYDFIEIIKNTGGNKHHVFATLTGDGSGHIPM